MTGLDKLICRVGIRDMRNHFAYATERAKYDVCYATSPSVREETQPEVVTVSWLSSPAICPALS